MAPARTAFITGAAQGLGKAIALRLASDGFRLALNDINLNALEQVRADFTAQGHEVFIIPGDVSKAQDVERMIALSVESLGEINVMIANAGICIFKPFMETTEEDWDRIIATNLRGTFLCYKYAAKQMITQGKGGKIIGACSLSGQQGEPMMSAYSSSKFAIRGLTQVAAAELGKYDITVNCYAPGGVDTPMIHGLSDQVGVPFDLLTRAEVGSTPMGRFGRPEDIANVVSFLASDAANWVTAQTITIDGGRHLIGSPYHGRE